MSHPDFILDKRIVDRNISKGLLTQEDVDKHIAKLKDMADNAEVSRPEEPVVAAAQDEEEGEPAGSAESAETTAPAAETAPATD